MIDHWLWHGGRSIRRWAGSYRHFRSVVKDYYHLDPVVKTAVVNASSSVVSIITRTGDAKLFIGSGTIIECDVQLGFATVLTSATLVRGSRGATSIPSHLKIEVYLSDHKLYEGQLSLYDFHYNIATIKIKTTTPLPTARTRYISDSSVTLDSTLFKLVPGERVIALGRDSENAREVMASPGVFSARDCRHDCKELLYTSCVVTQLAVGGPLVNCNGEVIGVNFFISPFNTFTPINIVSKCLEDLKRNRQVSRPWLGASIANLYSADLEKLDKLYQKFPSKGVLVEQVIGDIKIGSLNRTKVPNWTFWSPRNWLKAKAVIYYNDKRKRMKLITRRMKRTKSRMRKWPSSPASIAGLCANDIIIKCGGISVSSHLEFAEALWDKEGKPVELVVVRPSIGQKNVTLKVGTFPKMARWYL